jgi:hypothetical protein
MIERIRHRGDVVEVGLLLGDGRDALARLNSDAWEWLELRAGDIVRVRPEPRCSRRLRGTASSRPDGVCAVG